jgi:DNA topoisomerase-1
MNLATISLEEAITVIQNKRNAEANKVIREFPENPSVKVLNGQYGPYIQIGKRNVRIPKGTDPATLTLEQCLELGGETPAAEEKEKKPARKKAESKK